MESVWIPRFDLANFGDYTAMAPVVAAESGDRVLLQGPTVRVEGSRPPTALLVGGDHVREQASDAGPVVTTFVRDSEAAR